MMNMNSSVVWTTWTAHGGGEDGVFYAAQVVAASSHIEALQLFTDRFGIPLGETAQCAQGVVANGITRKLFSQEAFESMRKAEVLGIVHAYASLHVNYT